MLRKGSFINDVMQIWRFSEPTPPRSHAKMTVLLRPSYIASEELQPPPPLCVTSFMNDPKPCKSSNQDQQFFEDG